MMINKKFIIIGFIVVIVIGFIIWKMRSKSTYTVANLKDASAGTTEYAFYSNISTCQNTFTSTTLGDVMVFSSLTCDTTVTPNKVTATTLVPHKYATGNQVYIQGASSDGSNVASTYGYNTTPGTPISITVDQTDVRKFTYNATSLTQTCSTTPALTQFGYAWLTTKTNVSSANVVRETCISSNVSNYMNAVCPWTGATVPDTTNTNYRTYQDTHLAKIKDAYANLILTAPQTATASKASLAQIQAAREADFTGATRYFLNAVCPGYYAQTSTVNPGTTAVDKLPNTPYSSYAADTSALNVVGFNKDLVTDANILNWAKYASTVDANMNFTGTAPLVGGSSTTYNFKSGSPTFPSGMANWQIAQDIGPGTVTTAGPIEGTKNAAGTVITAASTARMHTS